MRDGERPNILIVLTDQQSHAMLSCAGTSWVSTPNLDRLAAGGVRFPRAYCSDPVCVPSRFSLFTGRMPSAIGMRGNGGEGLVPFGPAEDATGLGHLLRRAGYETWYGGKVHWPVGLTPARLGFRSFQDDEREALARDAARLIGTRPGRPWAMAVSLINPHDICLHALRAFARREDGGVDWRLPGMLATECSVLDQALAPPPGADPVSWIDGQAPPLPANHQPQEDEPEMLGEVLARRPFKARARASWDERTWRLHRWAYARLTERVDREIGVVLDALDASGQAGNTLVIFTSDHGEHAGAHRLEHKTFFYEEAARVPWLMRLPGRIRAGAVDDRNLVATGLDLMATCCDYAGVEPHPACRGRSLRPAAEEGRLVRDQAYGENVAGRMLATREWKLVLYDRGAGAVQLYDLVRDPGETRNHAAMHPGVVAELRRRLEAERSAHAALALGPCAGPPPAE